MEDPTASTGKLVLAGPARGSFPKRSVIGVVCGLILLLVIILASGGFQSPSSQTTPTPASTQMVVLPALYEEIGQVQTVSQNHFVISGITILVNGAIPTDIAPGAVLSLTAMQRGSDLVLSRYKVVQPASQGTQMPAETKAP
jgi:hypothetical protein